MDVKLEEERVKKDDARKNSETEAIGKSWLDILFEEEKTKDDDALKNAEENIKEHFWNDFFNHVNFIINKGYKNPATKDKKNRSMICDRDKSGLKSMDEEIAIEFGSDELALDMTSQAELDENHWKLLKGPELDFQDPLFSILLMDQNIMWRLFFPNPKDWDNISGFLSNMNINTTSNDYEDITENIFRDQFYFPGFTGFTKKIFDDDVIFNFIREKYTLEKTQHLHFPFTLREVVRLLKQDQIQSENIMLALVLPGGGVKATYQSKLIDHMYSQNILQNPPGNATSSGKGPEALLTADIITGNSGGALLGMFVASLEKNDTRELTDILWHKEEEKDGTWEKVPVDYADIFGHLDLMRWASFMVCTWTLCLILFIASFSGHNRHYWDNNSPKDQDSRWFFSSAWILLLLITPFAIKYVNGSEGAENVPDIQGIFYFICLVIAVGADNSFIVSAETKESKRPMGWAFWPLFSIAFALILIPLFLSSWLDNLDGAWVLLAVMLFLKLYFNIEKKSHKEIPTQKNLPGVLSKFFQTTWISLWNSKVIFLFLIALLLLLTDGFSDYFKLSLLTEGAKWVCAGMLLLALGLWLVADKGENRLKCTDGKILPAFGFIAIHIILTFFVLMVASEFGMEFSFFELAGSFWKGWAGAALVTSVVLFSFGFNFNSDNSPTTILEKAFKPVKKFWNYMWPHSNFIKTNLEYLYSHHPAGNLRLPRYMRITLFFSLGWLFWNIVVGPGIYGNNQAKLYFNQKVECFIYKGTPAGKGKACINLNKSLNPGVLEIKTLFAVPANSLTKGQELYFLFKPSKSNIKSRNYRNESIINDLTGTERWKFRDKRYMNDVVFSSGSPFPIFPAKKVDIGGGISEWLVDGGYAHNIPIEAAEILGARQVLVVDSSPPNPPTKGSCILPSWMNFFENFSETREGEIAPENCIIGPLINNLNRIVPFLFEQSQSVDTMSQEKMMVATLAPLASNYDDWPVLFDFRKDVIIDLKKAAKDHLNNNERIGRIKAWGTPRFRRLVNTKK